MESITVEANISEFFENEGVIYYTISLFHITNRNSWHVSRRFSEFEVLFNRLTEKFLDIPQLPSKAFWKKFTANFVNDRKDKLNDFIRYLASRQDILQQQEFREFLQLEENIPKSHIKSPTITMEYITTFVPISIQFSDSIFFIATNQQKISQQIEKIRAVILDNETSTVVCVDNSGKDLWKIIINATLLCMCWNRELTILSIGLNTGGIYSYRVKTEMDYKEYEEFSYLIPHTDAVLGICIDYSNSDIYSCGHDKRIVKSNLLHEVVLQEIILDGVPAAFKGDLAQQRLYVLRKNSGIVVFDSSTLAPCMNISGNDMSCMCLGNHGVVFVGSSLGSVYIYRDSVAISFLALKGRVICISYSSIRKELYVGNATGFISVWNTSGKLLQMWKAHEKGVSCLEQRGNELYSGGVEETFKVWALPIHWIDPEFEKVETFEAEIQAKTVQILTSQKNIVVDDLAGWDKS